MLVKYAELIRRTKTRNNNIESWLDGSLSNKIFEEYLTLLSGVIFG